MAGYFSDKSHSKLSLDKHKVKNVGHIVGIKSTIVVMVCEAIFTQLLLSRTSLKSCSEIFCQQGIYDYNCWIKGAFCGVMVSKLLQQIISHEFDSH